MRCWRLDVSELRKPPWDFGNLTAVAVPILLLIGAVVRGEEKTLEDFRCFTSGKESGKPAVDQAECTEVSSPKRVPVRNGSPNVVGLPVSELNIWDAVCIHPSIYRPGHFHLLMRTNGRAASTASADRVAWVMDCLTSATCASAPCQSRRVESHSPMVEVANISVRKLMGSIAILCR